MAKEGLKKWFSRNKGKGWVDCKTGKPCGRQKGEKRGYPACRPTMAECKKKGAASAIKKKTSSKRVNWQKKSTGGPMIKNKSKADLNNDNVLSTYEKTRGMAIEKAMAQQNRVKKKNGGFIAKGCGKVMNNRIKVTTIS